MQVQFSLDPGLRREEFVERALLFPLVITLDVEPHQLSLPAREALAQCHPDLPEIYALLEARPEAPPVEGAQANGGGDAGPLWKLKVNPNAYAPAEIVEMWARDYHESQRRPANDNNHNSDQENNQASGGSDEDNDWAKDVFDF